MFISKSFFLVITYKLLFFRTQCQATFPLFDSSIWYLPTQVVNTEVSDEYGTKGYEMGHVTLGADSLRFWNKIFPGINGVTLKRQIYRRRFELEKCSKKHIFQEKSSCDIFKSMLDIGGNSDVGSKAWQFTTPSVTIYYPPEKQC